jgi:hypothetical protein
MVSNHISAVNIQAAFVTRNAMGTSGLPDVSTPRAVACDRAGSIASHFDSGKLAVLPRLKSQIPARPFYDGDAQGCT